MTAKMAGHGRLSSQPQARNTKSGITMTACFMYLSDTAQAEGIDDLNVGLVAFNKVADQLLKLSKGDLLSVSGDLKINEWQGNDGTQRKIQIVVQDIVANKVTRPGGRTQVHAPEEYCNQAGLALRTVQSWKCLLDPEKFEFNSGCQAGFAKNKARIPRCLLFHYAA